MADPSKASGRTGSKISIYRCKYCGSTFVKADELIAHKRENHLAEIIAAKRREAMQSHSRCESNETGHSKVMPKPTSTPPPKSSSISVSQNTAVVETKIVEQQKETNILEAANNMNEVKNLVDMEQDFQPVIAIGSVKTISTVGEAFVCPNCNIAFNYDYQLIQHMSVHENESAGKIGTTQQSRTKTGADTMELDMEPKEEKTLGTTEPERHQKAEIPILPPCYVVVTRLIVVDKEPPTASNSTSNKAPGPIRRHLSHFGRRTFKCKYCHKRFQRVGLLNLHIKAVHHGIPAPSEEPKSSSESHQHFASTSKLTQLDSLPPVGAATGSQPTNLRSPKHHPTLPYVTDYSLGKTWHKCTSPGCNYATKDRTCIESHSRHHIERLPFQCTLCNATFTTKFGRSLHVNNSHSITADAKICNQSSQQKFSSISTKPKIKMAFNLQIAAKAKRQEKYRRQAIPDGLPHPCVECSIDFDTSRALAYHRRIKHYKQVKCNYCPYKAFRGNVNMHMQRLHSNKHGTDNECQYCGARCSSFGVLKKHIVSVHEKPTGVAQPERREIKVQKRKPWPTVPIQEGKRNIPDGPKSRRMYDCSHCPYVSYNTGGIRRHVRNAHTVQRRFKCEHCSASYDAPHYLEMHKVLHSQNSTREASPGPKIVSVTSVSTSSTSSTSSVIDGSSNVKSLVRSTRPTKSMAEDSDFDDDDMDVERGRVNIAKSSKPKRFKCKICGLGYPMSGNLSRHKKCEIHLYNENIYRRMNGLPLLKNAPSLSSLRVKKVLCSICKMVFQTWGTVDAHKLKNHGIRTKTEKPKQVIPTPRPVSSVTAIVQSQPRLLDKTIDEVASQGAGTDIKWSSSDKSQVEKETDNYTATDGSIWGKVSNSSVEKTELMDTSSSPEGKKAVSVTQQNKSGLKITTVRYGN